MNVDPISRLRQLCMVLPAATERLSHGAPSWFVNGKKLFVTASSSHHDDRLGFWCAAAPGEAAALVAENAEHFFIPPYVGHRGWLGVYLDVPEVDWEQVEEIVTDAYCCVAPKKLIAELESDEAV